MKQVAGSLGEKINKIDESLASLKKNTERKFKSSMLGMKLRILLFNM